jgi:hypothetical protein
VEWGRDGRSNYYEYFDDDNLRSQSFEDSHCISWRKRQRLWDRTCCDSDYDDDDVCSTVDCAHIDSPYLCPGLGLGLGT